MYIMYMYIYEIPVRELICKEDDDEGPAGVLIVERLGLNEAMVSTIVTKEAVLHCSEALSRCQCSFHKP